MIRIGTVSALIAVSFAGAAHASAPIRCWGNNASGQSAPPADLEAQSIPASVTQVRTFRGQTCLLSGDGRISCWGVRSQLIEKLEAFTGVTSFALSSTGACVISDGIVSCVSVNEEDSISKPPKLVSPRAISVGIYAACALDQKGVKCWGSDFQGYGVPSVPVMKNPRKVVVGFGNACALDDKGVRCWGYGSYAISMVPKLKSPKDIFIGFNYACALEAAGVKCWGENGNTPVPTVPKPDGAVTYSTGKSHVCSLDKKGVRCWGDDRWGQLQVPALSHPKAIFGDPLANHTCALDGAGVRCWGEDQAGQSSLPPVGSLSAGVNGTCAVVRGVIRCWGETGAPPALSRAIQVSGSSGFSCAVSLYDSPSSKACWGEDSTLAEMGPRLPLLSGYNPEYLMYIAPPMVSGGYQHACYELPDLFSFPSMSCWGNNDYGQTKMPPTLVPAGWQGALSAGGQHTCAIDSNSKSVVCWGRNDAGQSAAPLLKNPRQVSAGYAHTCALDDDGVVCWGRSTEGQTQVPALKNPRRVQAGGYHTCALDEEGVKCWGENTMGQSRVPADLPTRIGELSAGLYHTCAVVR